MGLVHCGAAQEDRPGPGFEHRGEEVRDLLAVLLLNVQQDLLQSSMSSMFFLQFLGHSVSFQKPN